MELDVLERGYYKEKAEGDVAVFEKFAFIRSHVKVHKRSIFLCIFKMLIGLITIPFITCLAFWVGSTGKLPARFSNLQFLLYCVLVGVYWYICSLRIWSHSYMLDYTQLVLTSNGHHCPRCYSPMKSSVEDYVYEEKIGEERRTFFYSNGKTVDEVTPIMVKNKETIPYFKCKNSGCALRIKARKSSAKAVQVKDQIKEDYSFGEMPRTLSATYRLIAGDCRSDYGKAMMDSFCSGGFGSIACLAAIILVIVSKFKNLDAIRNVCHLLFEMDNSKRLYGFMSVVLLTAFLVFQLVIKVKAASICSDESFKAADLYLGDISYDIYITKRMADTQIKARRKELKKARKEGWQIVDSGTKYQSGKKLNTDRKKYVEALRAWIKTFLSEQSIEYEEKYYNQCFIIRTLADISCSWQYGFYISQDSCFLRIATYIPYGAHQNYINERLCTWENETQNNLNISIDRDEFGIRLSCGILPSPSYDTEDIVQRSIKNVYEEFVSSICSLQEQVNPKILEKFPSEYGQFHARVWNGFTWQ